MLASNYIPRGMRVIILSENGVLGMVSSTNSHNYMHIHTNVWCIELSTLIQIVYSIAQLNARSTSSVSGYCCIGVPIRNTHVCAQFLSFIISL